MGDVSKKLKAKAVSLGLCQEWTEGWGRPTKERLVQMFIDGIDFCIKHDYPPCSYMKRHFDGVMQRMGVFVDDAVSVRNLRTLVANGRTKGTVAYDGYSFGSVYVRHESQLAIVLDDYSCCQVEIYDRAKVSIVNRSIRKCFVYQYGGEVSTEGNVVVKDRKQKKID